MRYRLSWLKDGKAQQLLTQETTAGAALKFAHVLLVEARPSDIWIETQAGRRIANYDDIVEEGPKFFTPLPTLQAGALRA